MIKLTLEELKYPIGVFEKPEIITPQHIKDWTKTLEKFPVKLKHLVGALTDAQLDVSYRQGGWTIRQVVHHLSDSHHNSYTRFKWALTEDTPVIKPYYEDRWAALQDSKSAPISFSLLHIKAIHAKLVYLIKGMSFTDLDKTFIHPETNKKVSLKENIGVYAWHSEHHYAHIKNVLIKTLS